MNCKILVLSIFLITATEGLFAQNKVWSIGPEAGVNFSRYGRDAEDSEYKNGFVGGLFLTYSVVNTFGITGKILYSEKGSKKGDTKQTLKYIEVPLTGRFFLNKEGRFRPNIMLGPSFAFLQGATNRRGNDEPVKVEDYKDHFNTYDFGVTGGLGLNFEIIPQTRILLDARYTYGLSDVTKADGDVNNEAITVTAGVSFGI